MGVVTVLALTGLSRIDRSRPARIYRGGVFLAGRAIREFFNRSGFTEDDLQPAQDTRLGLADGRRSDAKVFSDNCRRLAVNNRTPERLPRPVLEFGPDKLQGLVIDDPDGLVLGSLCFVRRQETNASWSGMRSDCR